MNKRQLLDVLLQYFFLFFIIALTGFEFFYRNYTILYFYLFPLSTLYFFYKKIKINKRAISLIFCLFSLLIIHSYKFNLPYSFAFTGFIRFSTYYFIAAIVIDRFNITFVKIVYWIAWISLVFYALTNISDYSYQFLLNISENIKPLSYDIEKANYNTNPNQTLIIHTIPLIYKERNSGPFWEPGMFAVFLNIAFIINIINEKKLFEKKNIIFFIASITTLSTTSLIATFIILLFFFIFIKRSIFSLFFVLFIPFFAIPLYKSDLIEGKINANIETINYGYSRFGAALVHYKQIKESPWVGYGLSSDFEQEKLLKMKTVSPNGLTNIIRYYGIPFSVLYYTLLLKFAKNIVDNHWRKNLYAIIIFTIILIVAFAQDVTNRHFYYVLLFIPLSPFNFNKYK